MNEVTKFLSDLESDQSDGVVDILNQPLTPTEEKPAADEEKKVDEVDGTTEDGEYRPQNRRERRLMQRLQEEKDSSIFLAGKLAAREEARSSVSEETDYLKTVERIYGTETPEAQLATDMLKKALLGVRDDAENRAYTRFSDERQKEREAEAKANQELDSYIDDIEDTYGVELTESQEKAYFQLLQKMSPKDNMGNVTSYADPYSVFEVFQERLKKAPSRAKDLSARSMTESGASKESTLKDDSHVRALQDAGII